MSSVYFSDQVELRHDGSSYDDCQAQQWYNIGDTERWFWQEVNVMSATVSFKTSDYHSLQYFIC